MKVQRSTRRVSRERGCMLVGSYKKPFNERAKSFLMFVSGDVKHYQDFIVSVQFAISCSLNRVFHEGKEKKKGRKREWELLHV